MNVKMLQVVTRMRLAITRMEATYAIVNLGSLETERIVQVRCIEDLLEFLLPQLPFIRVN